jgi:hypothetical protein
VFEMSLLIYIICAEVSVRGGDAAGMRNVVVFEGVSDVCRGRRAESGERRVIILGGPFSLCWGSKVWTHL